MSKKHNPVICSWKSDLPDHELTTQEKRIEQAIDAMDDLCKELDKRGWKYKRLGPRVTTEPYLLGSMLATNCMIFYDGEKKIGDAICQYGSYGYEVGLFEVAGSPLLSESITDDVQGWVTKEEIIERLGEFYGNGNK